jgi:hypothetical protein
MNNGNTKIIIKKKKYELSKHIIDNLKEELHTIELMLSSRLKLFITSRTKNSDIDIQHLFNKKIELINQIKSIKQLNTQFIDNGFMDADSSKPSSKEQSSPGESNKKYSNSKLALKKLSPKNVKALKKELLKQFRFKTGEECLSRKRSNVYYTSREEMINVFREHVPELIPLLLPAISKASKSDICKVIFS